MIQVKIKQQANVHSSIELFTARMKLRKKMANNLKEFMVKKKLTRYRVGEAVGMTLNERVLDVSPTDSVRSEKNECLPPVRREAHHLLVSDQVQLVEERRVLL